MGKYDDIEPDRLRAELVLFARLVQRMDAEGVLLRSSPTLLKVLGELRQMLFAYEIRATRKFRSPDIPPGHAADAPPDPLLDESLRIVRDAARRDQELLDELEHRFLKGEGDEEG